MQVGGGYRTVAAVEAALASGADRVMVGTAALSPAFLAEAAAVWASGSSSRSMHETGASPSRAGRALGRRRAELARPLRRGRRPRLLVTGTRRDGSLAGPDLELLAEGAPCGLAVLAAGGIASLDDLRAPATSAAKVRSWAARCGGERFTLAEAIAAVTRPDSGPRF